MDWNEILKDVISRSVLIIVGSIAGWFGGLFKGKKIPRWVMTSML